MERKAKEDQGLWKEKRRKNKEIWKENGG